MKYVLIAGLGLALAASAAVAEEAQPETKVERHVVMIGGDHARMDADGDGEVSRDEFMAMHAEMFAKLDADKNGKLSKEERHAGHMKLMRGGDHAALLEGPHGPHGPGDKRVRVLELRGEGPGEMDANRDGKISPEEFAAPMKRAFEAMDADKSGFLEEGERAKGPMRFEHKVEVKTEGK